MSVVGITGSNSSLQNLHNVTLVKMLLDNVEYKEVDGKNHGASCMERDRVNHIEWYSLSFVTTMLQVDETE